MDDEMWMMIKVYKYGVLNEFHPWTSHVEWILIVYEWKMYIHKWISFSEWQAKRRQTSITHPITFNMQWIMLLLLYEHQSLAQLSHAHY